MTCLISHHIAQALNKTKSGIQAFYTVWLADFYYFHASLSVVFSSILSWPKTLSSRSASWWNAMSFSCTGFTMSEKESLATLTAWCSLIQPNIFSSWPVAWIDRIFGCISSGNETFTPGPSTPMSRRMYSNLAFSWLKMTSLLASYLVRFRGRFVVSRSLLEG